MGNDIGPTQLEAALSAGGGGLLPPLQAGASAPGFDGPQQALAALVARRFKVIFLLCSCPQQQYYQDPPASAQTRVCGNYDENTRPVVTFMMTILPGTAFQRDCWGRSVDGCPAACVSGVVLLLPGRHNEVLWHWTAHRKVRSAKFSLFCCHRQLWKTKLIRSDGVFI